MVSHAQKWAVILLAGLAGGHALAFGEATLSDLSPTRPPAEETSGDADSVTVARRVVEAAGALERYFRTAGAIGAQFDSAASVSDAMMTSAAYEPKQLEEGAVAYAALIALQEPAFVAGLSGLGDDPSERASMAERLTASPEAVLEVAGARQAAGMAASALGRMGSDLVSRGLAVRQAAYAIQREPWSLQPVDEPAARLSRVKARAISKTTLSEDETRELVAQVVARRGAGGAGLASTPTPTIIRGLAIAALAMLGEAGEDRADALAPLLRDPANGECLKFAKLNLHQCLAVAGPQYEDVFCMGQHAMSDTGQCLLTAAQGRMARGIKVGIARAPRSATTVSIPVARSTVPVARSAIPPARGAEADAAYGPRPSATAEDAAVVASDRIGGEAQAPEIVEDAAEY